MNKKIIGLSKVFIKDYFQKLNIFKEDTKKINRKSIFVWLFLITVLAISFLSFKIIGRLNTGGQAILFLKIYLPIMATILIFQAILICTNVFFFSKDLEYILPLPIKPLELLLAKFNNIIFISYLMELLFLAIPLFIYGLIVTKHILYFFNMIFVLIIFPIFLIAIISAIMLFVMQLTRFIKNKDIFQILIVIFLMLIISLSEGYLINSIFNDNIIQIQTNNNDIENVKINNEILHQKLDKLNKYFTIINPCIDLLTNFEILNILTKSTQLLIICAISFTFFITLGKILYLKNLLKNIAYINKKKKTIKKLKNRYDENSIKKSYIKNEFKKLIKNPTYFIQCVFQYIFLVIIIMVLIKIFMPIMIFSFEDENILDKMGKNKFFLQSICMILGVIQIIFTLNNLSITAISREGKNAIVMKYIPVSLYKQFIWKNIPQIMINMIPIIGVVIIIYTSIPKVSILYYIAGIFIAILLNIINSWIMLIVNLKNPNIDWITESAALKDNGNKLYQYVTTIIMILLLTYLTKIFENINIVISLISIFIIFIIILILLKIYIKKNINKLFKKIN